MNDGTQSRVILRSNAVTMLCIALLSDVSLPVQTSVRATRSTFAHPVLERWNLATIPTEASRKRTEGLAQEIMELSEDQLHSIIPEQTPRIHIQCPVCAHKAKADSLPEQPQPFPGIFDPLRPDRVARCFAAAACCCPDYGVRFSGPVPAIARFKLPWTSPNMASSTGINRAWRCKSSPSVTI
jgi:hypothetical protein